MRRGLALGLALLAGACGPAAGQVERQPRPMARILSLNPCTDAILAEVAEPVQIAALSSYSRDAGQSSMDVALARHFPAVDGTLEEVVAAKPTLVVSGNFTPPASRAAMARLGLRLEEFAMPATVGESEAQIRRMAALAGHPERGEVLVARIEAALLAAKPQSQIASRPVSALVWQGGGLVAGPQTLIADLLGRTGFAPVAATKRLGQSQFLPLEEVVADPPAVILAVSRGGSHGASEGSRGLSHPVLAQLRGVARFPFDPALEYCGGPTILRAAPRLAEIRRAVGAGR